jgi:plasmid maintenance system antidote protein VapI
MIRVPTDRVPTHPGEMLLEEFLIPMGLTQTELANAILVTRWEVQPWAAVIGNT